MSDTQEQVAEISFLSELWRKGVHLVSLVIPASYAISGIDKWGMLSFAVPAFLLMLAMDFVRLRRMWLWREFGKKFLGGLLRQHEDKGGLTGASYILLSVCLVVLFFDKWIAIAAMSFIIVGDVFAALIGRTFGRIRIGRKTVEGSLGCLLGTVIVAFVTPNVPLQVGLLGAVTATIVEAFSLNVDDNITVPLASGLVMTIFYQFLANG